MKSKMSARLIAHQITPQDGSPSRTQTLETHSRNVARHCAALCRAFGLEKLGKLTGQLHDAGKAAPARLPREKPRRMTFKQRQEFEALDKEIPALEAEKRAIEAQLSGGTMDAAAITAASRRFAELTALIDEKTMRWLELSELEG